MLAQGRRAASLPHGVDLSRLRLAVKLDPSYNKNHFLAKENPRGNNA
jgi:hypothetical protein